MNSIHSSPFFLSFFQTTHLTKVLPAIPMPPPNVQVRNAPDQATVERTLNELGLSSLLK